MKRYDASIISSAESRQRDEPNHGAWAHGRRFFLSRHFLTRATKFTEKASARQHVSFPFSFLLCHHFCFPVSQGVIRVDVPIQRVDMMRTSQGTILARRTAVYAAAVERDLAWRMTV